MERKYTVVVKGKPREIHERYFGEVNIRHNESGHRFLYTKLIEFNLSEKSDPDGTSYQNYRELLLILFWPIPNDSDFDFTRGILLADKDVLDENRSTII